MLYIRGGPFGLMYKRAAVRMPNNQHPAIDKATYFLFLLNAGLKSNGLLIAKYRTYVIPMRLSADIVCGTVTKNTSH